MYSAYMNRIGKFLPGEAINHDEMEEYLRKMTSRPSRVSQPILNTNGIHKRYYAIDTQQPTLYSNSQMAAFAVRAAISQSNLQPGAIELLACATTLPDLLVSGFVSTVQGELSELSPLEIVSTQEVGCAGVSALNYAPSQLEPCQKQTAIAVAAEFPSRLF
ncbi:3-oxoacyl-[acyl-carrier-protein] synthase, KASIII [uncultured Microcoleus sp.]|uniref:3-oxoacyl-[acyl-carrier-protein] synthase, KASIII n=1 Tax=uncultured Microcoleus sp. TaxID=259945 RepID=A0A6J4L523_9CYAN|nr:3-oxoacyl-[acyl-carrier-protein] synthase, KASIII [uncultured Microcoleus sp.]